MPERCRGAKWSAARRAVGEPGDGTERLARNLTLKALFDSCRLAMTAFLVRRYIGGKPEVELRRVEAETEIEAAERICGGPLSVAPRPMEFCRAEVRRQSTPERRTFFYSPETSIA